MKRLKRRAGIRSPSVGRTTSDVEFEQKTGVNLPLFDEYPVGPHADTHLPITGIDGLAYGTPESLGLVSSIGTTDAFALANHVHVARIVPNAGEPTGMEQGQIIYDSNTSLVKCYIGTDWERLGPLTIDSLTVKANFPASNVVKLRFTANKLTYNADYIDIEIPDALTVANTDPYVKLSASTGILGTVARSDHSHALVEYIQTVTWQNSTNAIANHINLSYSPFANDTMYYFSSGWLSAGQFVSHDQWGYFSAVPAITSMSFITRILGYGISGATNPKIYKTTNGGITWTEICSITGTVSNQIFMANQNVGVAIVGASVYYTTDEWATYGTSVVDTAGGTVNEVSFVSGEIDGWAVCSTTGTNDTVYKTSDGGANWTGYQPVAGMSFTRVFAIDADTTFAGSSNGKIYYTDDGGANWYLATFDSATTKSCIRVWFASATIGWAVFAGSSATDVYKTTDSGVNWARQSSGSPQLIDVRVKDATGQLWGITTNTIYKSTTGTSWTTSGSITGGLTGNKIFFPYNRCWVTSTISSGKNYAYVSHSYGIATHISPIERLYTDLHELLSNGYDGSVVETDPIFTAWDKSTGISITESQISDLGTYLTSETDPLSLHLDQTVQQRIINGALWCDGTVGATPTSGAGTRLMWIPEKGAFRAGTVNSTQWDAANIGSGSAAFGLHNLVSGVNSAAFGENNYVPAPYAVAFGRNNIISLQYGVACGEANTASGNGCFVNGAGNVAGGDSIFCSGTGLKANGMDQIVLGKWNLEYTVPYTLVIGNGTDNLNRADALTLTTTGDLTIAGAYSGTNVTSGADPGHTHTGASLSGIDISDDTNLAVSSPISLTGDTIGFLFDTNNIWTGTNNIKLDSTTAFVVEKADGTDVLVVDTTNERMGLSVSPSTHRMEVGYGHLNFISVPAPASAATIASVSAGGSVTDGDHYYVLTYVTSYGETNTSAVSAVATAGGGNNTVNLSNIPVSTNRFVTSIKIYRSKSTGDANFHYLVDTIANGVTTYIDTKADASLGDGLYRLTNNNTTAGKIFTDNALAMLIGSSSTSVGRYALNSNTSGFANVAIGILALTNNTTGYQSVAIGKDAVRSTTSGYGHVGIGDSALYSMTGVNSVGVGKASLYAATGSGNTSVGANSGRNITSGAYNTILGYGAAWSGSNNVSYAIALGANTVLLASNSLVVGALGGSGINSISFCSTADTDISINFVATTNSGLFKWMEDEDYFEFVDAIKVTGGLISSDGTTGLTATKTFTDDTGLTMILTIKNGLITAVTGTGVT